MAISYHESTKEFHLFNEEVSYIIKVMENGQLENLYYGKKVHNKHSFAYLHEECQRAQTSVCVPEPGLLSMHHTRQEYPVYGTGDYRSPVMTILQENGSRIVHFVYKSHEIYRGKKEILPLPSTYVDTDTQADSLEILLYDELLNTDIVLTYTIYQEYPVITRNARIKHNGQLPILIERMLSASVEFLDSNYEMVQLSGAWGRERAVKTRKLEMGIQSIQGLAGNCSTAEHNPFLALKRLHTTESQGEAYGFSLVYSGNFLAQTEVSTFDLTRVMLGIHPENFAWQLKKGETFQTPEVVLVYSDRGFNKLSQTYHKLYRKHLMNRKWRDQPRPILLNNWEATYFDFDEETILKIARKAKETGIELFVLDDGWFGARNNEFSGLGDWYTNLKKLPNGIASLSHKIEEIGLKFGLWIEPEMVNKDSDLYREHPDWIIGAYGRFESHGRHQYVLDFSRKEVVDYIYEMIEEILKSSAISYIKWDMNRYMSEPFCKAVPACEQGMVMHRYILGVYDLYSRFITHFPHILFESCASGGGRFDPAMLYFAPQVWTSDNSDAAERTKIQYGTSYVYPLVSIGSHVSAVPNHQMNRVTPIESRANVAYFGTFGYELDLNLLCEDEIQQVKKQVAFMKKYRSLIQVDGDFYRLLSPFEGNETAWMVVSSNRSQAIVMFFQLLANINSSWLRLKLDGLNPGALYEVSLQYQSNEQAYQAYGDELMNIGIPVDRNLLMEIGGDFVSLLYVLKKVNETC